MDLASVIIGPIVTEKAERLKLDRSHVLRVHPSATKVELKNALRRFYDVEVQSVRVLRTSPKVRRLGTGILMEKRHRTKRMIVTLRRKSKALDLANFRTSS